MIVDEARELCFLHNPKCGGTSVRTELLRILKVKDKYRYQGFFHDKRDGVMHMENMAHLPFDKVQRILDVENYSFFGIVRDPYWRFVSAIREFESKHSGWYRRFNLPLIDFLWEMLTPESVWLPEFSWFKPQQAFFPPQQDWAIPCTIFQLEDPLLGDKLNAMLEPYCDERFKLPHLNAKAGSDWVSGLSEVDAARLSTLCQYLYTGDYRFCRDLGYVYEPPSAFQPLNHDSYMWKVRAIQTPKVQPSLVHPTPDGTTLFEQIQNTRPFVCN